MKEIWASSFLNTISNTVTRLFLINSMLWHKPPQNSSMSNGYPQILSFLVLLYIMPEKLNINLPRSIFLHKYASFWHVVKGHSHRKTNAGTPNWDWPGHRPYHLDLPSPLLYATYPAQAGCGLPLLSLLDINLIPGGVWIEGNSVCPSQ